MTHIRDELYAQLQVDESDLETRRTQIMTEFAARDATHRRTSRFIQFFFVFLIILGCVLLVRGSSAQDLHQMIAAMLSGLFCNVMGYFLLSRTWFDKLSLEIERSRRLHEVELLELRAQLESRAP